MQELLNHAVSAANVIPTFLLMFCIGYWLIVVMGFLSMDSLDIDVEVEMDVDVDADVEVDTGHAGSGHSVSWLNQILIFFNLAHVPFMVFFSFLVLPLWIGSMLGNYYFGNESFLIGLIILIPLFIISLFIAKFLTTPFVKVFKHLSQGEVSTKSYIGKICRVILVAKEGVKGQAEIKIEGGSYLITTTTQSGVTISKGESGLIIDYYEADKTYLIEPYYE